MKIQHIDTENSIDDKEYFSILESDSYVYMKETHSIELTPKLSLYNHMEFQITAYSPTSQC